MKWLAPALVVVLAHAVLGGIVHFAGKPPGEDVEMQRKSQAALRDESAAVWAALSIDPSMRGRTLERRELEEHVGRATGVPIELRGWEPLEVTGDDDWRAVARVERAEARWVLTLRRIPEPRGWAITMEAAP